MQAPSRIQRRSHGLRGVSTLGAAKVIPFHLGPAPADAPVRVSAPTSSGGLMSWYEGLTSTEQTGVQLAIVSAGAIAAWLLTRKPRRR